MAGKGKTGPDKTVWTPQRVAALREIYLLKPRPSFAEIAQRLGVTIPAVQTVASKYGLSVRAVSFGNARLAVRASKKTISKPFVATLRRRSCMTCDAPFISEGSHNRMCPTCRSSTWGYAA